MGQVPIHLANDEKVRLIIVPHLLFMGCLEGIPGNLHTSRIEISFSLGLLHGCLCTVRNRYERAVIRRTSVVACLTRERTVCAKGERKTWISRRKVHSPLPSSICSGIFTPILSILRRRSRPGQQKTCSKTFLSTKRT